MASQTQLLTPFQSPTTQPHMFWQPVPTERDTGREKQHKRSHSATSSDAAHFAAIAASRTSSVSRHDEYAPKLSGPSHSYIPGLAMQASDFGMSAYDPTTIRRSVSTRSGMSGGGSVNLEAAFASLMGAGELNVEDFGYEEEEEEGTGLPFMGIGTGMGMGSMGGGMAMVRASTLSRDNSTGTDASSVSTNISKMGLPENAPLNTNIWVPSPTVTTPKAPKRERGEKKRDKPRVHNEQEREWSKSDNEYMGHKSSSASAYSRAVQPNIRANASPFSMMLTPPSSLSSARSTSSASIPTLSVPAPPVSRSASKNASQSNFYSVAERACEERQRVRRAEYHSRAEVVAAFQQRVEAMMADFAEALVQVDEYERSGSNSR